MKISALKKQIERYRTGLIVIGLLLGAGVAGVPPTKPADPKRWRERRCTGRFAGGLHAWIGQSAPADKPSRRAKW